MITCRECWERAKRLAAQLGASELLTYNHILLFDNCGDPEYHHTVSLFGDAS